MNTFSRLLRTALPLMALVLSAWASEPQNPTPCTDPWVCDYPPSLVDKVPTGDTIVCVNTAGSWSISATLVPGQKSRCDETEPVGGSVTWSWTLNGPESSSGTGSSFTYTPHSCGDYTINWHAIIDSDDPCDDSTDDAEYNFNVPTPYPQSTISNIVICPGETRDANWTITNPSDECEYRFAYYATIVSGIPTITLANDSDVVILGPGESTSGAVQVTADQATKTGVKNLGWDVIPLDCPGTPVSTDWTATVITPEFDLTQGDPIDFCAGDSQETNFTITDTSECEDGSSNVTWKITKTNGIPDVHVDPSSGSATVPYGDSVDVPFTASAPATSKGGHATLTVVVSSDFAPDKTLDIPVNVFKLVSASHNKSSFDRWNAGATVTITAVIEGDLGDRELLYELINVDSGAVVKSHSAAATSDTLPVEHPGRYKVKVTACDGGQVAEVQKQFVLWTLTASPATVEFVWDTYKGKLDEIFASADQEAQTWTAKIQALEAGNTSLGILSEKVHERAQQVGQNLSTAQSTVQAEITAAETQQTALLAERAALEASKIQLTHDIAAAKAAKNWTLVTQLEAQLATKVQLLTANHGAIEAIKNTLTALKTNLSKITSAASRLASSAGNFAKLAKACELAEVVLVPLGLYVEITEFVQLADEVKAYQKELNEAKAEAPKYKNLIEASLKDKARRETPPLTKGVTITTIPGGLKVTLAEIPTSFQTKDKKMADSAWIPGHLLIFNGVNGWIGEQVQVLHTTAGVQGQVGVALMAYGNLGSSSVYAFCEDTAAGKIVDATSKGSTQEELLAAITSKLTEAEENEKAWQHAFEALSIGIAATGTIMAAIGLFAAEAFVVTVGGVIVLIGIAVGLIAAGILAIYHLVSKEPLVKSIIQLFPSSAG